MSFSNPFGCGPGTPCRDILNQINTALDKTETKLDEKVYGKTEIKVEPQYKTFRDKYNA